MAGQGQVHGPTTSTRAFMLAAFRWSWVTNTRWPLPMTCHGISSPSSGQWLIFRKQYFLKLIWCEVLICHYIVWLGCPVTLMFQCSKESQVCDDADCTSSTLYNYLRDFAQEHPQQLWEMKRELEIHSCYFNWHSWHSLKKTFVVSHGIRCVQHVQLRM